MTHNRRQVIAGASALAIGMTLDAHASPASSRSLIIVGDWGRDSAPHQRDVARQMDVVAGEMDCASVISVGDNFYEDGVQSVDDVKWRTSFEDIYSGPNLKSLPWYVALGNHDYGGVPQAQVDYTLQSDRWHMPSRYFKVSGAGIGMSELDMFVIDTTPLITENLTGNDPLNINARGQDAEAQLAWLDHELAASGARYKFVAGHHTIFSGGSLHGGTPDLIARLLPILRRNGVTAYINGHDHDLEHIVRDDMHFICSGAGSEARPVSPVTGTRFCLSRSGFAVLSVYDGVLKLAFRDFTGASCYQATLS